LIPDKSTMLRFEKILESIHLSIISIMAEIDNLIRQRDLLLPRLMSGKLKP